MQIRQKLEKAACQYSPGKHAAFVFCVKMRKDVSEAKKDTKKGRQRLPFDNTRLDTTSSL